MSGRRTKSKRQQGHPARVAAREQATPQKARTAKRARPSKQPAAARARRASGHARGAAARRWLAARWLALLERPVKRGTQAARTPLAERTRADLAWAAATGLVSAVLFATVISSHPGLSDASEAVTGVSSLGILHAPGYPAYVLVGKLFTLLEPFGGEALRVSLFSLVCASLSIAIVTLLARRCGAARWAASLGGLCLAASAGYWFYAGFAKHDMFSGLALVASLYLLLSWEASPTRGRLVALGAVLAVGLGSSWPLMLMAVPLVIYVLYRSRTQLSLRSFGAASLTGLLLVVAIYGFVMVRAAQNPVLNWGAATTPSRLISLIDRSDFAPTSSGQGKTNSRATTASLPPGASSHTASAPSSAAISAAAVSGGYQPVSYVLTYLEMFWQELGVAASLLALWGLLSLWRRRRSAGSMPLLILFGANLLGAAATVGFSGLHGYDGDLIEEGFLLGCYFPLACFIALGATDLFARLAASSIPRRLGSLTRRRAVALTAGAALAALALIPSVTGNWSVAHRSDNSFADAYARTVFAELPRHSVLLVWGADLNLPLTYRQVVYHERPDVAVIAVGGMRYDWYRAQISRLLGRPLPPQAADPILDTQHVISSLSGVRPVYIDAPAAEYLKGKVGYRTVGLVAQVVPGHGDVVSSPAALDHTLLAAEHAAGLPGAAWNGWPNRGLLEDDYATIALRVARAYYQQHDLGGMRQALQNTLSIDPGNSTASGDLSLLNSQNPL